jgi:hypothetical protein
MTTEDSANTLPVKWDEELAKHATAIAATERPKLSKISLRAGIMSYQGIAIPGNKLDCIIMGSAFEHRWYEKEFDPNNPANPACFALSLTGEDMQPHEDSRDPKSETCEACENFKWGSDRKGGRGKDCKAGRRFTLLPADAVKQGGVKKAEMASLTCPVTSVRNWANYVNRIASEYRRPPWAMLTCISVVPNVKTQFEVKFEALGVVEDPQALSDLMSRMDMSTTVLLAPYEASESVEKPTNSKTAKY